MRAQAVSASAPEATAATGPVQRRRHGHLVAARVALVHVKVVVAKFSSARIALLEKRLKSLRSFVRPELDEYTIKWVYSSSKSSCLFSERAAA